MPNNYSRGKIYKIVCRKTGLQYFGSTTEPTLARRLAGHVGNFKRWKNGEYNFTSSFTILEENDYYIELVELVVVNSKDELLVRERYHIQNTENVNMIIPLRTQKEYYEANKEEIVEYHKEYYQANKEQIAEKNKEYYQANKEQIAEKMKEHYQINKEQIVERKKERYDCPCGSTLRKSDKATHEKTILHQTYLKNIASKSLGEICCVIENGENIQVK